MKRTFSFEYISYDDLRSMPDDDLALVVRAQEATRNAIATYSNFHVGAAAKLRSGKLLLGSNVESEVYPAGLCAERTLLFHHEACYADDPIEVIAIASDPSERECYPCGQCRQVLVDVERRQGSPMRIIMAGADSATVVDSAEKLLPFTFKL